MESTAAVPTDSDTMANEENLLDLGGLGSGVEHFSIDDDDL